jgi:hypothetical protein
MELVNIFVDIEYALSRERVLIHATSEIRIRNSNSSSRQCVL